MDDSRHRLPIGYHLNQKYEIRKVLGEGGFGITYLARDIVLDLDVAVKEYYPSGLVMREITNGCTVLSFTGDKQEYFRMGREKFIQEAQALGRLSGQPGIVSVKDYFQANNTAYIVMEYLQGETLRDYLNRTGGQLTVEETLQLLEPVVKSLMIVHQIGLVHRDISPDNIMLLQNGKVKLLDFGAARDISINGERSLSVMLKPGYAPEEQYRSRGKQGPWSDVYALCATIYRCVTGKLPDESMERMYKDELKPVSFYVGIDPQVNQAIMQGLAVHMEDRLQNAEMLYKALYQKDAMAEPRKPVPPVQVLQTKKSKRKKIVIPVLVVLVLALVAGIGLHNGWFRHVTAPEPVEYASSLFAKDGAGNIYLEVADGGICTNTSVDASGIPKDFFTLFEESGIEAFAVSTDDYFYLAAGELGILRFDSQTKGDLSEALTDPVEKDFILTSDYIYYRKKTDGYVYRCKTDGSEEELLVKAQIPENCMTVYNDAVWFYGTVEGKKQGIYCYDINKKRVKYVDAFTDVTSLKNGDQVLYITSSKQMVSTYDLKKQKVCARNRLSEQCEDGIYPATRDAKQGYYYAEAKTVYFVVGKNKTEVFTGTDAIDAFSAGNGTLCVVCADGSVSLIDEKSGTQMVLEDGLNYYQMTSDVEDDFSDVEDVDDIDGEDDTLEETGDPEENTDADMALRALDALAQDSDYKPSTQEENQVCMSDFNGDGMTDVLFVYHALTEGNVYVWKYSLWTLDPVQGETKLQENILYKIVGGNKGKIGFAKFEDTMYLRIESEIPSGDANTVEVSYLPWSSQSQAPSLDGSYYLYGSYAYENPENGNYKWGDNSISRSDFEQSYNAWEWKYCINPLVETGNGDVMTFGQFRGYLVQLAQ